MNMLTVLMAFISLISFALEPTLVSLYPLPLFGTTPVKVT